MKKRIILVVAGVVISVVRSYPAVILDDNLYVAAHSGLSVIGWHANIGANGVAADENNVDGFISPIAAAGGYIFYQLPAAYTNAPVLNWTDKAVFGSIANVTNLSAVIRNTDTAENLKFAIKVDGLWYASQSVFNNPQPDGNSTVSLAVHAAAWNSFALDPGTGMAEGGAAVLPASGTVQGVGLFDSSDGNKRVRIEQFAVEGVGGASPGNRIVCIGDSITQANSSHFSYRYELWKRLADAGVSFDLVGSTSVNYLGSPAWPGHTGKTFDQNHEGHWGWRADQILASLAGWLGAYTPDIAVIHLGSNDMSQGNTQASTKEEIKQIIGLLRADNPNVVVLLCKLIPWKNKEAQIQDLNDNYIAAIPLETSTAQSPVILVDQFSGIDVNTDLFDGIHPNAIGEAKVAAKYYEALRPYLSGLVDEDSDGMHDQWEVDHFGNLSRDGTGDADADGYSDQNEYVLGTDPQDSASSLHFSGAAVPPAYTLGFQTVSGRFYRIEFLDSLTNGTWQEADGIIGWGGFTNKVYETAVASRFYRLKVAGASQ
ncbi:MAG: SGNH/GDSL hydrolase family protein [Kiritimatiellales bacterium]|nr:SGNH/GDSL hydrolase family protein [Kiritimatiellales bacterium]